MLITAPFGRLITAMVTPFTADGSIDWDGVAGLAHHLADHGHDAIAVNGTTGEAPTTKSSEKLEIIKVVKNAVGSRVKVLSGAGDNETSYTVEQAKRSADAGADGLLIVAPYYNKPPQAGLLAHFRAIAASTALPVILYNVPGRTVTDIHNDTTLELAGEPNIVGIKDATGDLHRGRDLITRRPDGFMVYSGDDGTAAELVLSGADGDISVTANVAPAQMAQLMNACLAGNRVAAEQIDQSLRGLHSVLFQEPNPIPAKWVLSELGLMRPDCRLPLVPVSEALKPLLRQACVDAGVRL